MQKLAASAVKGTKGRSVWFGQRSALCVPLHNYEGLVSQAAFWVCIVYVASSENVKSIMVKAGEYCTDVDRQAPRVPCWSHCCTVVDRQAPGYPAGPVAAQMWTDKLPGYPAGPIVALWMLQPFYLFSRRVFLISISFPGLKIKER